MKTDIRPLARDMRQLLHLNPVEYHWKKDPSGKMKIGLLAQDVERLIPEVVIRDDKTGVLGMNYAELVPALVNMLQQQQRQLTLLNEELQLLEK